MNTQLYSADVTANQSVLMLSENRRKEARAPDSVDDRETKSKVDNEVFSSAEKDVQGFSSAEEVSDCNDIFFP